MVGASFTSVSFWKTLAPAINKNEKIIISAFIIASTLIFTWIGNPVRLLVMAGVVNCIILPIALAVILVAANKSRLMKGYRHSLLLQVFGWLVVLVLSWMSFKTIVSFI